MPNRYNAYIKTAPKIEIDNKVTINRYNIGVHDSGMLDQSVSFINVEGTKTRRDTQGNHYELIAGNATLEFRQGYFLDDKSYGGF